MNVVRCKNGHYFDADTYEVCPHCKAVIADSPSERTNKEKDLKKKSLWKHKEKDAGKKEHKDIERTGTLALGFVSTSDDSKDLKPIDYSGNRETGYTDEDKTVSLNEMTEMEQDEKEDLPAGNSSSLQDVVKNASANSEGKTLSYFDKAAMSAQTGNQNVNTDPVDPVVGWLVCIAGKHFGESFHIGAGKNSIGRSGENRIVFAKDDSISRTKHALIIYEPKKRDFYIQPGDSSGLTYLNDNYIVESHKLNAKDIIELGNSKFMFIPLCGEDFTWENYMNNE